MAKTPTKNNGDDDDDDVETVPLPKEQASSLHRRLTVALNSEAPSNLQRTQTSPGLAVAGEHVMELEFEEWDGSTPFYKHCIAGSLAGVAEHCTYRTRC